MIDVEAALPGPARAPRVADLAQRVLGVRVDPPHVRRPGSTREADELADIGVSIAPDGDARRHRLSEELGRQRRVADLVGLDEAAREARHGPGGAVGLDPDDVVARRIGEQDVVRLERRESNGLVSAGSSTGLLYGSGSAFWYSAMFQDGFGDAARPHSIEHLVRADGPHGAVGCDGTVDDADRVEDRAEGALVLAPKTYSSAGPGGPYAPAPSAIELRLKIASALGDASPSRMTVALPRLSLSWAATGAAAASTSAPMNMAVPSAVPNRRRMAIPSFTRSPRGSRTGPTSR
jgi:hypothetical protein